MNNFCLVYNTQHGILAPFPWPRTCLDLMIPCLSFSVHWKYRCVPPYTVKNTLMIMLNLHMRWLSKWVSPSEETPFHTHVCISQVSPKVRTTELSQTCLWTSSGCHKITPTELWSSRPGWGKPATGNADATTDHDPSSSVKGSPALLWTHHSAKTWSTLTLLMITKGHQHWKWQGHVFRV